MDNSVCVLNLFYFFSFMCYNKAMNKEIVSDYFKKRNKDNNLKLKELLKDLPAMCQEFFVGVENRTSALTRVGYAYDLRIFFDFLTKEIAEFIDRDPKNFNIDDLNKITATHLETYLSYLGYYTFNGKEYSNDERAKSRKLAVLRAFFKYFFNKDKIISNVTTKVSLPKLHDKSIIRLEVDEVVHLLDAVESGQSLTTHQQAFHVHTQVRDTALLTLMLGTGIRVSECVGINLEDIDFNVNGFKVTRKGGGQVILYFNDEVRNALLDYLEVRNKQKNVPEAERALFVSLQGTRIGVRAVQKLVKKYAEIVTPLKHITPHKLRSTYGTNLYRETGDIYIVADVLGHRDINTTKKHYAAQSEENRRNAASKVQLRNKN